MVHKILPCIISQQSCEMSLYKLNQLGMLFCVIFNDIQTEKEKIDTKETDLKRLEEKKTLECQYFTGRRQIHVFLGSIS